MSVTERFPATQADSNANPFGEITKYDPTQVAGYEQLVKRFESTEAPADTAIDALNDDYVDTGESTPMFDELVSEQSPAESAVESSSSRLANFLRSSADGIESTAERFDDAKDRAKKKLRLFGRAALRASTATGEFALGAGMLAANKGLELADRADAAVFNAVDNAKDGVKNTYNAAADKTGDAIMNGFAAVENGMDKVGEKMISFKDGVKEKLVARKTAALARRQARRERWSNRATSVKESVSNGLDRSAELAMAAGAKLENGMDNVGTRLVNAQEAVSGKVERTKASVHTTRAAGRAALEAFQATQRIHAEQNQL